MRALALLLAALVVPSAYADPVLVRDPVEDFIDATIQFVSSLDPNDPPEVLFNKTLQFVEKGAGIIIGQLVCQTGFSPDLTDIADNPVKTSPQGDEIYIKLPGFDAYREPGDTGAIGIATHSFKVYGGELGCAGKMFRVSPPLIRGTGMAEAVEEAKKGGEEPFENSPRLVHLCSCFSP